MTTSTIILTCIFIVILGLLVDHLSEKPKVVTAIETDQDILNRKCHEYLKGDHW